MTERSIISAAELRRRAAVAKSSLSACTLCERRCGVNRLAGERAPCGLGDQTYCFKRHLSMAEEVELVPSYMVYLGGCNFRCGFCVQAPVCFDPARGQLVDPVAMATHCIQLVARGVKSINLLGGEPSLHVHTILEVAAAAADLGHVLPLVLNSNFYMTPEVLDLLDGVVSVYLADYKFGNNACAARIAGVDRYVEVLERNLLAARDHAARNGAAMLIRHLLMPGHAECCLAPVARFVAAHVPNATFHVMDSYVPAWRAVNAASMYPELAGLLGETDREAAAGVLSSVRLTREGALL